MKKLIAGVVALMLFSSICALAEVDVVTTIFPIYDWTREIAGDADVDLTLLLDSGVDLHSFQPTAQDIMKIATCDVFAYVGGESDEWVEDALRTAANPDMVVVDLLDALGDAVKIEETVEGMQADDEDEEEDEADEHVWLSLKNAQALTRALADALAEADPANADSYRANADAYVEKLAALDAEYSEAVANAQYKTLLFGDRFPFRYLADDYGLSYYAAFSGCSAESEASFETVVFLAGKVDELQLPAVLTIEGTDHRIADTVVQAAASDPAVLTLDSMQGTTMRDAEAGATYLGIMEQNLEVLKRAIG
ncbi:MAG: zinc ABC transporter substrate-binding protein [Clostridia bacterium]|nr:zinc ABC transporter substrate-binding protein [Clostridia bacterium]